MWACEFCHCAAAPDSVVQLQWEKLEIDASPGSVFPLNRSHGADPNCGRKGQKLNVLSCYQLPCCFNWSSLHNCRESAFSWGPLPSLLPSTGSWPCRKNKQNIHLQKEYLCNVPAQPQRGSKGQKLTISNGLHVSARCKKKRKKKITYVQKKLHLLNCK